MGSKEWITPKSAGSPDFLLIIVTLALLGLGVVMVFSSSVGYLVGYVGTEDIFRYVKAQAVWAGLGLFAMFALSLINHNQLKKFAPAILLAGIVALVLVHVPGFGVTQRGSTRWLKLGLITIQPSESIKLALALFFAAYLARVKLKTFRSLGFPLAVLGACALLVLKQPDLGTTMVIVVTVIAMFFAAGMPLPMFLTILGAGAAAVALEVKRTPYMLERIQIWLDPWSYVQGKGYQTVNALLALGSGGIFGTGLGRGMQKFGHVPENYTDMIFAIIGEELGLVGTALVILLFGIFVWRGLTIAVNTKNPFSRSLAVGITCMVGFQALINLGVVTSLLPVTGVTLPFISYGGNSLTLSLAGVGILLNISRYADKEKKKITPGLNPVS